MHLSVTPPPQMPATMEAGTIQGYCVGEPWNQQAVFKGIGVPVITDYEIWPNNPAQIQIPCTPNSARLITAIKAIPRVLYRL